MNSNDRFSSLLSLKAGAWAVVGRLWPVKALFLGKILENQEN